MDLVIAEQLGRTHPLARHLDDFLTDLANAEKSAHTRRAYRGDLIAFAAHHGEELAELTAAPVHVYLAGLTELSPASRKLSSIGVIHSRGSPWCWDGPGGRAGVDAGDLLGWQHLEDRNRFDGGEGAAGGRGLESWRPR